MRTRSYFILLEDTGRTFNINMHTYECFANSKEEAVGQMYFARPEFRSRPICKITEDGETVYIDKATIFMLREKFRNGDLRNALEKITGWQDETESIGERLNLKQHYTPFNEDASVVETWIIGVGNESFFYTNLAVVINDFQLLRQLLTSRSGKFKY